MHYSRQAQGVENLKISAPLLSRLRFLLNKAASPETMPSGLRDIAVGTYGYHLPYDERVDRIQEGRDRLASTDRNDLVQYRAHQGARNAAAGTLGLGTSLLAADIGLSGLAGQLEGKRLSAFSSNVSKAFGGGPAGSLVGEALRRGGGLSNFVAGEALTPKEVMRGLRALGASQGDSMLGGEMYNSIIKSLQRSNKQAQSLIRDPSALVRAESALRNSVWEEGAEGLKALINPITSKALQAPEWFPSMSVREHKKAWHPSVQPMQDWLRKGDEKYARVFNAARTIIGNRLALATAGAALAGALYGAGSGYLESRKANKLRDESRESVLSKLQTLDRAEAVNRLYQLPSDRPLSSALVGVGRARAVLERAPREILTIARLEE